jgi:hypothetical protein
MFLELGARVITAKVRFSENFVSTRSRYNSLNELLLLCFTIVMSLFFLHVTSNAPTLTKPNFPFFSGITIAICDDGFDLNHPDIKANFNSTASFNFNKNTTDVGPNSLTVVRPRPFSFRFSRAGSKIVL